VSDAVSDPEPLLVSFVAGFEGLWRMEGMTAPRGEPLRPAARLAVVEGAGAQAPASRWTLRGVADHPPGGEGGGNGGRALGGPDARCAALVAIRLAPAWWEVTGGDGATVLAQRSRALLGHPGDTPKIARRLHHSRDLGEPFDLLAWFEFHPDEQAAFNDLMARLRATEGWSSVEREVDVRLIR
jgi:hypothetical protein